MTKSIKKSFKNFFKIPALVVFAFVCIAMLPKAINMQSIAFRSAIATAVGVDLDNENQIELTVAINISSSDMSLSEKSKVISAKGKSLGDAFTNLNTQYGKSVKLGHTRFVIIGQKLAEQNVTKVLDRLMRTTKMRNTVQLLMTPSSVPEIFSFGAELENSTGAKMSDIICYQQKDSTTSIDSNLDEFFSGYMSKSQISKLNIVELLQEQTSGIPSSNGESQNSSSQSGGQNSQNGNGGNKEQKKFLVNEGRIAIFKEGKLALSLSKEETLGLNYLSNDFNPKDLFVAVNNGKLGKSTINFDILYQKVKTETFFIKGIPIFYADIVLSLDIDEIINDNNTIESNYNLVDDDIKSQIGNQIRDQVGIIVKLAKEQNIDIFKINDIFYAQNYADYSNYIEKKSQNDFLENLQVAVNIEIKIV